MTGVFGVLKNSTGEPIVLVDGASPAAGMVEMHEVAMVDGKSVMRKVVNGLTIPAQGQLELKPGHEHIMLMKMTKPIATGESVQLTVKSKAGVSYAFTVTARPAAVGGEPYQTSTSGHAGHGSSMPTTTPTK